MLLKNCNFSTLSRLRCPPAACTADKRVKMHARAAQIIGQIATSPLLFSLFLLCDARILRRKYPAQRHLPFSILGCTTMPDLLFKRRVISPCARICFLFSARYLLSARDEKNTRRRLRCWLVHSPLESARELTDRYFCAAIYPTTCEPHIRTFMVHTLAGWLANALSLWLAFFANCSGRRLMNLHCLFCYMLHLTTLTV